MAIYQNGLTKSSEYVQNIKQLNSKIKCTEIYSGIVGNIFNTLFHSGYWDRTIPRTNINVVTT